MNEHVVVGLTSILVLGLAAQWTAWRLKLPSILMLLGAGFAAGAGTGWLDPDALLGQLLVPLVSLSVAVILFEGGLSLRIRDLPDVGSVVTRLITLGVLATWIVAAAAAHVALDFTVPMALLLGSILVVTGPTVIGPLLRHVRPTGRVGSILRWEGILIDPVGASLAVIVFEAILLGGPEAAWSHSLTGLVRTLAVGLGLGGGGAVVMAQVIRRHWIPEYLQNPATLTVVVSIFAYSNHLQDESGLLTVTVLGMVLANQRWVAVHHIIEFKENLRVLLISSLFIVLAARLRMEDMAQLGSGSLLFLAALFFIARPAGVFLSTIGSGLSLKEKLFLSWMAPRGIVAAAVASIFALRLREAGFEQADQLVPLTFLVIIGTVAGYGLTAAPLARSLGLSHPNPQGLLVLGSHPVSRALVAPLKDEGIPILLVDANRTAEYEARMAGLPSFHGDIVNEPVPPDLQLEGIGKMLAMTSNDEVNTLAALNLSEEFGRPEVYQLATTRRVWAAEEGLPHPFRGRALFSEDSTFDQLVSRLASGSIVKKTQLSETFDYEAFKQLYGETARVLFVIDPGRNLKVITSDHPPSPAPDSTLISLVDPPADSLSDGEKGGGSLP